MINKVTITGIDDTTNLKEVYELSKQFPFVEWGVLISDQRTGNDNRFPALKKLRAISEMVKDTDSYSKPSFSLHLCGKYLVDSFQRGYDILDELNNKFSLDAFERIQINCNGRQGNFLIESMLRQIIKYRTSKQFIFQFDGATVKPLYAAIGAGFKAQPLHDKSGGRGVLPESWPYPVPGTYNGYAGGLSPLNIKEQIQEINRITGNVPAWIDMESGVRDSENILDMEKVRRVLKSSEKIINQSK